MLVNIINGIISFFSKALSIVYPLLPNDPFASISYGDVSSAIKYFTYFVPVHTFIVHFGYFLAILAMFYLYRVVLNWIKILGE